MVSSEVMPVRDTSHKRSSNAVRWRPNDRRGHVESFFLKANAPGEGRAIWLRFTLLVPRALPETARAEVWAMAFDRRAGVPRAWKVTAPAGATVLAPERLGFALLGCELEPGRTHGKIPGATGDIAWDISWTGRGQELRLLPRALYKSRAFPRTKLVSPEPDARFSGSVRVADQVWDLEDWPGMQGHNWGLGHATRYAWAHCNAFADHPGTVFEGTSAAVNFGSWTTPLLTLAVLRHAGRTFDLSGVRHWYNRSANIERGRWTFRAVCGTERIDVSIESAPSDVAGLIYEDPDGEQAICLNSKLARCRIDIASRTRRGFEWQETLVCDDAAALEILSRDGAHGVTVLL